MDDRQPEEDELLTLSNFFAREDRETRQIVVHMTRLFAFKDGWVGDADFIALRFRNREGEAPAEPLVAAEI